MRPLLRTRVVLEVICSVDDGNAVFMAASDGERAAVEFFILPETFKTEMCAGFAHETVARVLKEHGCLVTEAERFTVKPRLPGMGPARCYHIKPEIFALDL